jgi:3-oxoacyl-[acyl-carrier-protein] synthase II
MPCMHCQQEMMIQQWPRPMDKDRDGFVLGEVGRNAEVCYRSVERTCEIGGGGMSADAYHITAPHPD